MKMPRYPVPYLLRAVLAVLAASLLAACASLPAVDAPVSTPVAAGPQLADAFASPTPTQAVAPVPFALPPGEAPTATPAVEPYLTGEVRVFPGPRHYVGDLITVEAAGRNLRQLSTARNGNNDPVPVLIVGDEQLPAEAFVTRSPLRDDALVFRWAWDTTGFDGGLYRLSVTLPDNHDGAAHSLHFLLHLEPAEHRPAWEEDAAWAERRTRFSQVRYLTHTAAERDIDLLASEIDAAFTHVVNRLELVIPQQPVPVTLLDNVWGHGGYVGSEIVISYTDRLYTGPHLPTVLRHEAVHWAMRPYGTSQTPALLSEGLAVVIAGGHYKPEPIRQRAAALLALDAYIPLADLADEFWEHPHEIAYLDSAGLVTYLIDRYGLEPLLHLYGIESATAASPSAWLEVAFRRAYGVGLAQIEADYLAWLGRQEPGQQVDDLRLTVRLYDTIRRYQALYAPYQEALPSAEEAAANTQVSEFTRKPCAPFNVAVEGMLLAAQNALQAGRYEEVALLLEALNAAFDDGDFTREPVASYLAIAERVDELGAVAQRIELDGDRARVLASHTPPQLDRLALAYDGEAWHIAR